MINRILIRLKIIQIVYAFYVNGSERLESAEKELFFSLSKAYDLYQYFLLLIVAVTDFAQRRIEAGLEKNFPTEEERNPNKKFINNRLASQMRANTQLSEFASKIKKTWEDEDKLIRGLYEAITESDTYKNYMASEENSYEEDRELWRKLYKDFVTKNDSFDSFIEEGSLYWNDDKDLIDTFVLKTIKMFKEENGADQPLLPEYHDEEDRVFASRLFTKAITNEEYYYHLITETARRNWDFDRIAFMDIVIMQCALAEMLSFPNIPISVTLNEYIELAKCYSTSQSAGFVNGTLDAIARRLVKEGKLNKRDLKKTK